MARVLAYSFSPLAHVYALVPTLLELRARGHKVCMALLGGPRAVIEVEPIPVRCLAWRQVQDAGTPLDDPYLQYGAPVARGLDRLLDELRPDLVMVDADMWEAS